jgi:hypothetical protein
MGEVIQWKCGYLIGTNMKPNDLPKIEFHEQAAARFTELAQEVLAKVGSYGRTQSAQFQNCEIHPVAHLTQEDVIRTLHIFATEITTLPATIRVPPIRIEGRGLC